MIYCRRCGARYDPKLKGCPQCAQRKTGKYARTTPAPKRRRKKRTNWLPIILLLAILIAVVVLISNFFGASEEETVANEKNAIPVDTILQGCKEDLNEFLVNAPNLSAVNDRAMQYYQSGSASAEISLNGKINYISAFELKVNVNNEKDALGGTVKFGLDIDGNTANFSADLAINENILQVSAPSLLSDVLQIDLTSGEMTEQPLLQIKATLETIKTIMGNVEATNPVQEKILFGSEERECTVYNLNFDEEVVAALGSVQLRVAICDDRAVAWMWQTVEGATAQMLLCGKENPWSDISLKLDGKEQMTVSTVVTDSGFESIVTNLETSVELCVTCDDAAQTLNLFNRSNEESLTISYGIEDGKILLVAQNEEAEITMSIGALEEEPTLLSESAVDVTSLDQDGLYSLLIEIMIKLQSNPQTAWLYELMTT